MLVPRDIKRRRIIRYVEYVPYRTVASLLFAPLSKPVFNLEYVHPCR